MKYAYINKLEVMATCPDTVCSTKQIVEEFILNSNSTFYNYPTR